eukprot:5400342-Amphidinium_carterae.1
MKISYGHHIEGLLGGLLGLSAAQQQVPPWVSLDVDMSFFAAAGCFDSWLAQERVVLRTYGWTNRLAAATVRAETWML